MDLNGLQREWNEMKAEVERLTLDNGQLSGLVERLAAENNMIRNANTETNQVCDKLHGLIERLRAENDAYTSCIVQSNTITANLREALEEIHDLGACSDPWDFLKCVEIASEALWRVK